jgi:1,4-dihydroxy-6-naphthoate synthase
MAAKKSAKKKATPKKSAAKKSAAKKSAPKKAAAKKAAAAPAKKKAAKKKAAVAPKEPAAEAPAKKAPGEAASPSGAEALMAAILGGGAPPATPATKKPKSQVAVEPDEDEDAEPAIVRKPVPKMPKRAAANTIRLVVGKNPVAAFMVYALAAEKVDTSGRTYVIAREDQHVIDAEAKKAKHDVAFLSFAVYPEVDDRYMLLPCGGSFGDHRGPLLVSRKPIRSNEVNGLEVAVPGRHSSAALALQLWLPQGRFDMKPVPVRHVSLLVRANQARSGLLVNEDQATYRNHNLIRIVDLGQWWGDDTEGLPLPLTLAGVRRDIPVEERAGLALDLKRSIAYGLGHREEALEHAVQYAPKLSAEQLDKFIDRYVNDLSLDFGVRGRQAVETLYERSIARGLLAGPIIPEYHGVE